MMRIEVCKTLTFFTTVLVTIAIAACDGSDPSSSDGASPASVADDQASNIDQPNNTLSLTEDSYLITTTSDAFYRISAQDGEITLLGRVNAPGVEPLGPVDVVDGSIIVSASNNSLVSLNPETGNENWSLNLGPADGLVSSPSAPSCSSTVCYVVSDSKDIFAINAIDGSVIWSRSLDLPDVASSTASSGALLVSDDRIFVRVGFESDERVNVYSRSDGQLLESIQFEARVSGTPLVVGNYLVVSTLNGLYAFDSTTYGLIWRAEVGSVSVPVIVANTVVVIARADTFDSSNASQVVIGIDLQSGEVRWMEDNGSLTLYEPTTDSKFVYVLFPTNLGIEPAGRPRAVDPIDGSIVWQRVFSDRRALVGNEPLAVPGFLFFNSYLEQEVGLGFAALDSNSGEVLWVTDFTEAASTEIERESVTSVLVHEGQVYRNNSFPTLPK